MLLFLATALALAGSPPATPLPTPEPPAAAATVTGRVVDAEVQVPLDFATVAVYTPDSLLVTGASTDSSGRFALSVPKGQYRLQVEFIGYQALSQTVRVTKDVDVGDIALTADAVALDEATVTAQRSQLSLKLDRQIFDVGADVTSAGGSANEVLANVPSVDVSPEGEVSLRGSNGVKVLVNGKPSTLADNNALGSIPAANIERVEIMTSPSARYEAAGSGGIINIILKENLERSVGGQISVSVGAPTDYRLDGSFSASQNKWTVFGNGGLRTSKYFSTGEADRISTLATGVQKLREDLVQNRRDLAGNAFAGFDYRPRTASTLSASYSYYYQLDDDLSDVAYTYRDGDDELERDWRQRLGYREPGKYHQIEASWSEELAGEDTKLFVLFQNDFWISPEQERTTITETFPRDEVALLLETESLESSTDYLLQADYEQPLGEHGKLEAGLRGETRVIASDYLAEEVEDGERSVYLGFDNEVDYFERIGAAYLQYAYEHDGWGLQAGLRDEYTAVRVEQTDGEAEIVKRYNNLFPSLTLSRQLNEAIGVNASFTSRIRRPGFWAINPFGGLSNPNEIELGNADINPSYIDATEVKLLIKNEKLTVNPYFRLGYVRAPYDRSATQDEGGVVRLLLINLDREQQLGGGITASYSPTPDWQISGEGYLSRFQMRGMYEGVDFASDFTMKSAQVSVRGKVVAGVTVQGTFDYWSGQQYAQFFNNPVTSLQAGASRKFLDDRLQVSLNVRNLFGLQKYSGGSQRATFSNTYERVWQQERWLLTAAWELGKAVGKREARERIR